MQISKVVGAIGREVVRHAEAWRWLMRLLRCATYGFKGDIMGLVRLQSKRSPLNRAARLIISLGLAMSGIASAQQAATIGAPLHSEGEITVFSFGGLTWRMPWRFFQGIRPFTNDSQDLLIVFGWEKSTDTFPADAQSHDMQLSVQVRNVEIEDPRNALSLIKRIKEPFEKVPLFAAAKFDGMTYLGSSSSIHYFVLDHEDAYVSCMLTKADRLMPPKVAPDVLSKKFSCDTTFRLPHSSTYYAWVKNSWADLNDVGPAFISVHREIFSFIR
jgi:hypothetical protein